MIGTMTNLHINALSLQLCDRWRYAPVAASHHLTSQKRHLRHSRDPLSTDAHKMQMCLLQVSHPFSLFLFANTPFAKLTIVSAMSSVAVGLAKFLTAFTIESKQAGDVVIYFTRSTNSS